jgi:hypothetical protein
MRALKRWAAVASLALGACATTVPGPRVEVAAAEPVDAWARVLERFVDEQGRVDFDGLARDRGDLDRFVAWVYAVGPGNAPARFPTRAHLLAYHLNAYNALAMYNVLEDGIPVSLAGARKVDFFALRRLQVGSEPRTLYGYENEVIRPLGDERVHFALNCMVVGCPRLPRTPFRAADLDAALDRETRRFFAEPRNVVVDPVDGVVRVSELLRFYPEDFLARAPTLVAYVNRYREPPIPTGYRVEFIPYDWTINRQPPRRGARGSGRRLVGVELDALALERCRHRRHLHHALDVRAISG